MENTCKCPAFNRSKTSIRSFRHLILTQDNAFGKTFLDRSPVDFPMFFTYGTDKDRVAEACKEVRASEMNIVFKSHTCGTNNAWGVARRE